MHFSSVLCMVFASFTTTLHISLKLSSSLFPLEVACGNCYCNRCIVLLVGTLVLGRLPMFYCHMFGGLVCLEMYLLLFRVVLFASIQSLALKHPQVYCTLLRFPANVLRYSLWILSLTYPPCGGFNDTYTCVYKLTKFVKLIPVSIKEGALSAPKVACLFFKHVVQLFGIPRVILHDCDACFTGNFWHCLWELLGSQVALSLAYHPQKDGQTEHTHKTVE